MTKEQLDDRILTLKKEQLELTTSHDQMVQDFNKNVAGNQTRYAQLTGAITVLIDLRNNLNGENP